VFTVIVPTHNRPVLLQRTLQSLIAQTYKDFTVIVVDDSASYIPPYAELAALQGRYLYLIRSADPGPATSRNMALALLPTLPQSRYTLFLDDDDTFAPTHLESLAAHLSTQQTPLVFCDFTVQYEDRSHQPPQLQETLTIDLSDVTSDSVFVRNRIPNSSLAYRNDVLAQVRNDPTLEIYEDWEFLMQCLRHHPLVHIPVASVVIHKSRGEAAENLRRGNNSPDAQIVQVMLQLYKMHPAPNLPTRHARQALLASAGINVSLDAC
jgi:glycosyltransferase involved in cell wall biosynthesis